MAQAVEATRKRLEAVSTVLLQTTTDVGLVCFFFSLAQPLSERVVNRGEAAFIFCAAIFPARLFHLSLI